MKRFSCLLAAAVVAAASPAFSQVANLKIVTDANPDYSDMESMTRSETKNWESDADKMWHLFFWDHIARRQTTPIWLHGYELTDPIRNFNDYGFTMCSTISGIKCSEYTYMGYPCRFWEISLHTVCDVWYDNGFHHYDNSLSAYYTRPDGQVAAVDEIGKTGSGPETGGKDQKGYIARFRCATATGLDSFLQGADTERPLKHMFDCFDPKVIHYQWFTLNQNRGHRYILNLRDNEVYTRNYSKLDKDLTVTNKTTKKDKELEWQTDPACYVPNLGKASDRTDWDPQAFNRINIRGNGDRTFNPILDDAHLPAAIISGNNIKCLNPGLTAADPSKPAEAVFKIEGSNVITSLKIHTLAAGNASLAVSTSNGLQWKNIDGDIKDLKLIPEVNGAYEVLVKVTLNSGATLNSIAFDTITELNNKTQPRLNIGKNTIYVGDGEQTESIVFWPEWREDLYKSLISEESNVKVLGKDKQFKLVQDKKNKEGYLVFKFDAPQDITAFTAGGRFDNRADGAHMDILASYDAGKTWNKALSVTDHTPPYDYVRYTTVTDIPAGTRSVLLKYSLNGGTLIDAHMEVNHKLAAPSKQPLEVTFNWSEVQPDYSLVKRSHTQLVDHLPMTYNINVAGADHPVMNSMAINLKGARPDVKYGYSDGNENANAVKWNPTWATYGNNLALHKKYTCSKPSEEGEAAKNLAGDPHGDKLTDGRLSSSYTGGDNLKEALWYNANANPEFTVDLGKPEKCAAFRFHLFGYKGQDALKGEIKDKIEILTSNDGDNFTSVGFFDTNMHNKDVPINFMLPDDETLKAPNLFFAPKDPVEARYVRYKVTSPRVFNPTEIQVLDSYKFEPHDMRLALPDPADNGKRPANPDVSPNARKFTDDQLPKNIIGVQPGTAGGAGGGGAGGKKGK